MDAPTQDDVRKTIARDLGIENFTAEEQQELIAQFGEVALKAATVAIVEKLSPDMREKFATLVEAGDPKALSDFFAKELPDHEAVAKAAIDAEIKAFKEALAAG